MHPEHLLMVTAGNGVSPFSILFSGFSGLCFLAVMARARKRFTMHRARSSVSAASQGGKANVECNATKIYPTRSNNLMIAMQIVTISVTIVQSTTLRRKISKTICELYKNIFKVYLFRSWTFGLWSTQIFKKSLTTLNILTSKVDIFCVFFFSLLIEPRFLESIQ